MVLLTTAKLAAGVPAKDPRVAPVRFVPVIVTVVPPKVEPDVGDTLTRVGAGTTNVNLLFALTEVVPPGVVTATST